MRSSILLCAGRKQAKLSSPCILSQQLAQVLYGAFFWHRMRPLGFDIVVAFPGFRQGCASFVHIYTFLMFGIVRARLLNLSLSSPALWWLSAEFLFRHGSVDACRMPKTV